MQAERETAERRAPESSRVPAEGEVFHTEGGDLGSSGHGRAETRLRDLAQTDAASAVVRQKRGREEQLDGGFSHVEYEVMVVKVLDAIVNF